MVEFKTFYFLSLLLFLFYFSLHPWVHCSKARAQRNHLKRKSWDFFFSLFFKYSVVVSHTHSFSLPFLFIPLSNLVKKKEEEKTSIPHLLLLSSIKFSPFYPSALHFLSHFVCMEIWAILLQTPTQIRICGSHGNEAAELVNWHPPVLVNTWYTDMEAHQDFSQHCVLLHNLLAYACMLMM